MIASMPRRTMSRAGWCTAMLICGGLLLATGCGSASGGAHRPKFVPYSWDEITTGSTSRTLLIAVPQPSCLGPYKTRVATETRRVIRIELLEPNPETGRFRCPAQAVRGTFSVRVRLPRPYHRQKLVDASTGRAHKLTPRSVYGSPGKIV